MTSAAKPMIRSDSDRRQQGSPWPILLVLLLLTVAAVSALYTLYKLTALPRLQVCNARLEPLVYNNDLNRTFAEFKLNVTLCWK